MITGKYILNMLSRAETWPEAEGFTGFADRFLRTLRSFGMTIKRQ